MNALELLPKSISYNGSTFFLRVWITARGKLCVGYKELGGARTILPYVVETDKKDYIPAIIEETETSGLNEHIGNHTTLDKCITSIIRKINELLEKGELQAEY